MPNKIIDVILSGAKYLVDGTTTVFY